MARNSILWVQPRDPQELQLYLLSMEISSLGENWYFGRSTSKMEGGIVPHWFQSSPGSIPKPPKVSLAPTSCQWPGDTWKTLVMAEAIHFYLYQSCLHFPSNFTYWFEYLLSPCGSWNFLQSHHRLIFCVCLFFLCILPSEEENVMYAIAFLIAWTPPRIKLF